MAKKAESRPRVQRTIQSMVDMEIPEMVKSSIYPWESLIPQDGDDPEADARNFFVQCEGDEDGERLRSSAYSSGRNYFLKRRTGLIPLCRILTVNGVLGVGCWAAPVSS